MLPTRWSKNLRGPSGGLSDKPGKARKMLEAAKAATDPLLIEGIWRTQAQSHTSFEPHAAVAQFNGEHLTVYLSTQAVREHAKLIAEKYGWPAKNVLVIADHVGGGFGSKGALRCEAFAAIELARAASAPVRVVMDRHEELSVTGYRPGAELVVSLLPSRDGALKALIDRYGGKFPSLQEAQLVHRKAQQITTVVFNAFSAAKHLDSSPPIFGLSPPPEVRESAKQALIKQYPTMESLFGSLDFCECEDCGSVLGPAAYLVDLLQFLDHKPADWQVFLADCAFLASVSSFTVAAASSGGRYQLLPIHTGALF
jgi:Molybdopterin-binding domain of aldehyde dehydrogenase